jgi:integrase
MNKRGSVYRRGSTWTAQAKWTQGGRTRQVKKGGFRTKAEASAHLDDVIQSIRSGSWVAPSRLTVRVYLDAWLEGRLTAGGRATTTDSYRRALVAHVYPTLGDVEVQSLTALDLDRLYGHLLTAGRRNGRGLSPRTVRYVHTILGKALADAERKALVVRNVARQASPPTVTAARAPEATVWTPADTRLFLDRTTDHHHHALFRVAAMTGLRRGELCGLRWEDVDLDAGLATVRQSVTAVGRTPTITGLKSKRSRRTVDLDPITIGILRDHRRGQLEVRLMVGSGYRDHGLAFAMPDGRPWHPDVITRAFDRLVRSERMSDLPRIRLHDLRHGHATHLLAAGTNPRIVSERLGHASVAFTLDTYGHVLPGQQAAAAAAVAALIDG